MDALNNLLRNVHIQDTLGSIALQGGAALVALLVILRFRASKNRTANYITDFTNIARKVDAGDGTNNPEEFDVIVVGGGRCNRETQRRLQFMFCNP